MRRRRRIAATCSRGAGADLPRATPAHRPASCGGSLPRQPPVRAPQRQRAARHVFARSRRDHAVALHRGVEVHAQPDGTPIAPFRLMYEDGWKVRRVTVDLAIRPDDDRTSAVRHEAMTPIRLVGSASPRSIDP